MDERFDVVILGAGPAGEVALNSLLKAGKRVALVESELIGGECTNWGCIPSKTLLRPPELRGQVRAGGRASRTADARLAAPRGLPRLHGLEPRRLEARRALRRARRRPWSRTPGRLAGPGRVEAGGRMLETDAIVVATGAERGRSRRSRASQRPATGRTARRPTLTETAASAVFIGGGVVARRAGAVPRPLRLAGHDRPGAAALAAREEPQRRRALDARSSRRTGSSCGSDARAHGGRGRAATSAS